MPSSFISYHMHYVFSTKGRRNLIFQDMQTRLRAFMGGIARQNNITAIAIGGGFVYWADSAEGAILRANLDGPDRITLVTGLHRPSSLALDSAHAALYCVTRPADFYTVGDFDGTVLRVRLDRIDKLPCRGALQAPGYITSECNWCARSTASAGPGRSYNIDCNNACRIISYLY